MLDSILHWTSIACIVGMWIGLASLAYVLVRERALFSQRMFWPTLFVIVTTSLYWHPTNAVAALIQQLTWFVVLILFIRWMRRPVMVVQVEEVRREQR